MQCERCGLEIRGNKTACPLCGGQLKGEVTESPFPVIAKPKWSSLSIGRIAAFALAVLGCVMVIMALTAGQILSWQPLVIVCALVCFVDLNVVMYYRTNVLKTITAQLVVGMIACVLVDYYTGWHAWSIVWVLPAVFTLLMPITLITGKLLRMRLQDFVLYLLFDAVASLFQLIFLISRINPLPITAELSFAAEFIIFAGIICFRWRDFRSASHKYFNI